MKDGTALHPRCPVRTTLELLWGKWRLLLIQQLSQESLRFGELRQRLPAISEKMLAQELKALTEGQLIERLDFQETPARVSYQLTAKGRKVLPLLEEIKRFGLEYMRELE